MRSSSVAQERPLPGLSTTTSPAAAQAQHDLRATLAAHRSRPIGPGSPMRGTAAAHDLGRRAVCEIRAVALASVDHHHPDGARRIEHALARGDHRLQWGNVVAERFAETSRLDEIALHVDDDQRRRRQIERIFVRFGLHRFLSHVASVRPALVGTAAAAHSGFIRTRGGRQDRASNRSWCARPAERRS
jgi:hypothetical protein